MKSTKLFQTIGRLLLAAGLTAAAPAVDSLDELRSIERKTEALAEKVTPSTVALLSEETGAAGSGVVVEEDGLILTAAHVIDGAEEVRVVFPSGKETVARPLGSNLSKDVGMARITEEGEWPAVELGRSEDMKAGDWVVAMGHSEGYDPLRSPPMRFGKVVSLGPTTFLTTDCTLIGGDSGGPLFDLDGRLIAINSSIGQSWSNNNHTGIEGFREDWDRMLAGDTWGELKLNPLANPERPMLGIVMGYERRDGSVPVVRAVPGSPAAKAGIRGGDVIRSVDGVRVRGGHNLGMVLAKYAGGDVVTLGIRRGGQDIELEVELVRADELEPLEQ